jgi:curli biogenesis system outer membrane secretion channel CsgG
MKRLLFVLFSALLCWSLCACATTYVEEPQPLKPWPDLANFPPYDGPKTVVAVLPLGLSERAAKAYPHLLAKDVGLGIHNRVIETLYDTNRFRFVEEKPEVVKDVLDRQWMSMAGMVDQGTAVEMGRMLGASKVIYGEVYDFAQGGEQISGFSAKQNFSTRMGIQVRCVDVETLEYVPGSGTGRGADVGEASDAAIHDAVAGLIRRMK